MKHHNFWAILCHISIIFAPIILPGIVYLIHRSNVNSSVKDQALEALAFHLYVAVLLFISTLLTVILIGIVMWVIVPIWALWLAIKAARKANENQIYHYPFSTQFVKMMQK